MSPTAVPQAEEVTLHGHTVVFRRTAQHGPAVLLVHGIAGSMGNWDPVLPLLGEDHYVVAPDLLGHGQSAKPRGDYSLGAYASGLRDLMEALEIPSATVVGHSLGGGIAMQFVYQFPERCERLALVDSGGLGATVTPLLRAATLPGAGPVIAGITSSPARAVGRALTSVPGLRRIVRSSEQERIAEHISGLSDPTARTAFLHTVRGVLDAAGQRINATDRLYLAQQLPTLVVWGERDRFIPVGHGRRAAELVPGSRLEVFPGAGHFPHQDDPERFAATVRDFIATTEAARLSTQVLRETTGDEVRPRPHGSDA